MPPRLPLICSPGVVQVYPRHVRTMRLLKRPLRPTHFPQLIIMTDGSCFTQLTTSPRGVYRTAKDSRNHPLWNPAIGQMKLVEEDEAGRLKAFREKFGGSFEMAQDFSDFMSEGFEMENSIAKGTVEKKKKAGKK